MGKKKIFKEIKQYFEIKYKLEYENLWSSAKTVLRHKYSFKSR